MARQLENLYFELTGACNLLCKHCYVFSAERARERPDTLTLPLIERTIESSKSLGLTSVTFTGGEIFLRPDVRPILSMASNHARLFLLTNLTLLREEDFAWLSKLNVALVSTSLDGLAREHDSFRKRSGAFDRTLASVLKLRDLNLRVKVSVTVHPGNVDSARALFAYLDREGIPSSITRVAPVGRGRSVGSDQPISFDRAYYRLFADRISKELGKPDIEMRGPGHIIPTYCGVGESILYVMSNGVVGLCPTLNAAQGARWVVGDLSHDEIDRCWARALAKSEALRCANSGHCEFGTICRGGCRANAFAHSGDAQSCDHEMLDGLNAWRREAEGKKRPRYQVV